MFENFEKKLDIDSVILRLTKAQGQFNEKFPITEHQIESLCYFMKSLLISQPMLLELQPPIIVCGDIHGQYKDLLNIFQKIGEPGSRNYLFLGDYVDRGKKSLQCYCLLMAYKIKYPFNFFILRGNHECCELNKIYGFYDQCKRKFSIKLWKTISLTFDYLPIAAVIGGRIFCVHGGISPLLKRLDILNQIKRPISNNTNKLICDMLWSDPSPKIDQWDVNFQRGISCVFGKQVINNFIKQNKFDFICRSHQVVEEGYQFFNDRTFLTIFSAPNYCGQFENLGGVLKITKEMICSIQQFKGKIKNLQNIRRSVTPMVRFESQKKIFQQISKIQIDEVRIHKKSRKRTTVMPNSGIIDKSDKQNEEQ